VRGPAARARRGRLQGRRARGRRLPPAPESTTVSSDASSPVGALLAVFFRKDDEPSRGHVRVEPTPIVTEKTLGFGLTLHW
jgi:hypothetical protein